MPRITRKNQKIFAESATNNGVFGSLQANDPTISNDPDVIQGRSAYANGWNDAAYSSELLPPLEEFQALQYLFSRQLAYLFQEGIAEWNTSTTYYIGSIVKVISSSVVKVYMSIVNNNTGNQTTDTTKWKMLFDSSLGYAYTDMSNLTSVGKNLGNWSTNLTNCITEIPQDITLELSSGTLTLKAGSKLYIPNGSGTFNTTTVSADVTRTQSSGGPCLCFFYNNTIYLGDITACYSGTTAPTPTTSTAYWYDTTNNSVKRTSNSGSTWTGGFSLPFAVISISSGAISSIDQVFNGVGYIGSTAFVLPNVKGLVPNGRNSDGTLKNTSFTVSSVRTSTYTGADTVTRTLVCGSSDIGLYATSIYDSVKNQNVNSSGQSQNRAQIGIVQITSGKITELNPKPAFHAADYYDYKTSDDQNVKLTGSQTIAGTKTFTSLYQRNTTITKGTAPSSNTYYGLYFTDKNGSDYTANQLGQVQMGCMSSGDNQIQITAIKQTANSTDYAAIGAVITQSGNKYGYAPTPSDTTSTSSTKIATTGWVNSTGNNVMHLTDNETAAGDKTFSGQMNLTKSANDVTNVTVKDVVVDVTTTPTANRIRRIRWLDKNDVRIGEIQCQKNTSGEQIMSIIATNAISGTSVNGTLSLRVDNSGKSWATAPTPSSNTDHSSKVVTTDWAQTAFANAIGTPRDVTILWGDGTGVNTPSEFALSEDFTNFEQIGYLNADDDGNGRNVYIQSTYWLNWLLTNAGNNNVILGRSVTDRCTINSYTKSSNPSTKTKFNISYQNNMSYYIFGINRKVKTVTDPLA